MPACIAMLRGVNVGGKTVPMERLRASFAALGFRQVKTCVQSGNVVFDVRNGSAAGLAGKIERQLRRDFGFAVPVFLKTSQEMRDIVKRNPFLADPAIDHSKLHVTFLSAAAPGTATTVLQPLAEKPEQFRIRSREIYLYCPNGYGRTRLANAAIEKKLSVAATTRNWRTVNALLALAR